MKNAHAVFALGLGTLAAACAGTTDDAEGRDDAAPTHHASALSANRLAANRLAASTPAAGTLGFGATPPPPTRHVIRTKSRNCNAIAGASGQWIGEGLTTAVGPSQAFCAYVWTPAGKNWPADWTALAGAAETDEIRNSPYVVQDVRPSNTPAGSAALGEGTSFTILLAGPGGNPSAASGFALGGGGAAQQGSLGLTTAGRVFPEGLSGCEVCQEEIGNYLLFVLPPEALAAETLSFQTETTTYEIGSVTVPIFYVATPPSYAGWSYVSWE